DTTAPDRRCHAYLLATFWIVERLDSIHHKALDKIRPRNFGLAATGTLRCTVEQRTNRPPLDCPVLVRFTGPDHAEHADVAGYTRLRMRPFDPSRDALTEHAQVDERLLRLFDPLHDDATLDPDDVQAFCRLFAACVR